MSQATPKQQIASDQLDELREHTDRTASLSVHVGRHPYVRWNGQAYEIAEYGYHTLEITACEKDDLLNLLAENPTSIIPSSEATVSGPNPGRQNVWKMAEERPEWVVYNDNTASTE